MRSKYFPEPKLVEWKNGIRQYVTKRGDTEILISYIPPKTKIDVHNHQQAQIGMVLKGELYIEVGSESMVMTPLESIYVSPPHVPHGGENRTNEEVVALDIKRYRDGEDYDLEGGYFKLVHKEKKLMKVMDVKFFYTEWAEIMLADIPKNGGIMPNHKHLNEQIGICIDGLYEMTIEGENKIMEFGDSYFCGPKEYHSAINKKNKSANSINIFIPPRYKKLYI